MNDEVLIEPLDTLNPLKSNVMHIDEFLDDTMLILDRKELRYPHFMFNYWRMASMVKSMYRPFMQDFRLFVDFEGMTYRVVGASRLGDVWLTSVLSGSDQYERRVGLDLDRMHNWRANADYKLYWEQRAHLGTQFYGLDLVKSNGDVLSINTARRRLVNITRVPKNYLETTPAQRTLLATLATAGVATLEAVTDSDLTTDVNPPAVQT